MEDQKHKPGVIDPESMAGRELAREEFQAFHNEAPLAEEDKEVFGLVSAAIHSYGAIRAWEAAARYNLVRDIVGVLHYQTQKETTDTTAK